MQLTNGFVHGPAAVKSGTRGCSFPLRAGPAHTGDLLFQTPLSEPVFEPDLSELRVIFGNKRPLTHMHSVIKSIRIGDNLTRVTECAQAKTNQFIEAEFLRTTNLNCAVHRCSDRNSADCLGDIVGGP
jgi:hypothetical protein